MKGFLAFDIGCIECGEESSVVGFYGSRESAEAAIARYLDGGTSWGRTGWIGQHSVEIFPANITVTDTGMVSDVHAGEWAS